MPTAAKRLPKSAKPKKGLAAKVTPEQLRALRERSKVVRADVAAHRAEIDAEGDQVLEQALASGRLAKVTILLKGDTDAGLLAKIDQYAERHGLQSRAQVIRAALAKLLKMQIETPKWGWQRGRSRKAMMR